MSSTWTLANLNASAKSAVFDFDYPERFKTQTGGRYWVMCPDGSTIEEPDYKDDGMFGGKDIYALVVEWNRGHTMDALARKGVHGVWGEIAEAYDSPTGGEGYAQSIADDAARKGQLDPGIAAHWKHEIGTMITFRTNNLLPYPVKISSSGRPRRKYPDLPASYECHM